MKLTEWKSLTLLKSFCCCNEDGDLVKHEVRRDQTTGLTLKASFPVSTTTQPQSLRRNDNGRSSS